MVVKLSKYFAVTEAKAILLEEHFLPYEGLNTVVRFMICINFILSSSLVLACIDSK